MGFKIASAGRCWELSKLAISVRQFFGTQNQRKFLRVRRGCQASQRKGLTSGEVRELPGKFGEVWGSLGNFRGTSGLLLNSTVRELPGKSPKNFWGSSGNFWGSPGTSQKLGGAWLPPSDSPNLSPTKGYQNRWASKSQVLGCQNSQFWCTMPVISVPAWVVLWHCQRVSKPMVFTGTFRTGNFGAPAILVPVSTCSFCCLYFVKEFPRFGRKISSKID